MGDSERAQEALKPHRRWIALHENTLAKLDVILAIALADGVLAEDDFESLIADLDEARKRAERVHEVSMDAPGHTS